MIQQIMEAICKGGDEAHEAALMLGLLLKRASSHHRRYDDARLRLVLGDQFATRKLSAPERKNAVGELIEYVTAFPDPHPMAVWALTQSNDRRILPVLVALLRRVVADPAKEHLAYQALVGITSSYDESVLAALTEAAQCGHGLVRETAMQYLHLFLRKGTGK